MYKLLKADLHLHTLFSDNIDKLDLDDYKHLSDKYGYDVLALTDHHYCLKDGNWDKLYSNIDEPNRFLKGYEITFLSGHMLVIGKDVFDIENKEDAIKEMYNNQNVRIIAHPDYNIWSWKRNMIPKINGIEVINDMVYWKQPGKYSGIKSYKKYLLMKQKVSPFANTDCHRKADFGRVWTGIYVEDGEKPLDGIKKNRSFATTGKLSIEFNCSNGNIMGDTISDTNNTLNWIINNDADVTVYCGDIVVVKSKDRVGQIKPTMNGPYWITARNGYEMAMSSPIWVNGIETSRVSIFSELVRSKVLNSLNKKLNSMLELLYEFKIHDNVWYDYFNWLKKFSLDRLDKEDLAGKSYDVAYEEIRRRLIIAIGIAKGFMVYLINHYIEDRTLYTKIFSYLMPKHTFENIIEQF